MTHDGLWASQTGAPGLLMRSGGLAYFLAIWMPFTLYCSVRATDLYIRLSLHYIPNSWTSTCIMRGFRCLSNLQAFVNNVRYFTTGSAQRAEWLARAYPTPGMFEVIGYFRRYLLGWIVQGWDLGSMEGVCSRDSVISIAIWAGTLTCLRLAP